MDSFDLLGQVTLVRGRVWGASLDDELQSIVTIGDAVKTIESAQ